MAFRFKRLRDYPDQERNALGGAIDMKMCMQSAGEILHERSNENKQHGNQSTPLWNFSVKETPPSNEIPQASNDCIGEQKSIDNLDASERGHSDDVNNGFLSADFKIGFDSQENDVENNQLEPSPLENMQRQILSSDIQPSSRNSVVSHFSGILQSRQNKYL